jgi:hypothetical protein
MHLQDKKSIEKIAALLMMCQIMERVKMRTQCVKCDEKEMNLTLLSSRNELPFKMIQNDFKI